MATKPDQGESRAPLSKERVLRAAIVLADGSGLESLTMRRLGQELGVEAMSLYHHVANKDDVLDGIVDLVVGEIAVPAADADWKAAMRQRSLCARELIKRHRWAPRLIVSRVAMSPAMLRYMDSVMGTLRRAGFSNELAHHAMHVMGSRMLGFTQELFDPGDLGPEVAGILLREIPSAEYPHITEALREVHHDDDVEFEFGLDLILDGLERARDTARCRATVVAAATHRSPRRGGSANPRRGWTSACSRGGVLF